MIYMCEAKLFMTNEKILFIYLFIYLFFLRSLNVWAEANSVKSVHTPKYSIDTVVGYNFYIYIHL